MGATAVVARRLGTTTRRAASGHWRGTTGAQRVAYLAATLLAASGVFHLLLLLDGTAWTGPVSWRKPATFGLSFGLTLATVAYTTTHLSRVPRLVSAVLVVLALACAGEVAAVTLQRWRGVPSHFNETTAFDAAVWSLMGALILVVAVCVLVLAFVSFVESEAPATARWGVRLALVALIVGQVAGVAIVLNADALPPDERFDGAAVRGDGDLKLVHAVALHAAQVVLAFAVLASNADWSDRTRTRRLGAVAAGCAVVVTVVAAQASAGLAPTDLDLRSAVFLAVGLATVGISFGSVVPGVGRAAPTATTEGAESEYP